MRFLLLLQSFLMKRIKNEPMYVSFYLPIDTVKITKKVIFSNIGFTLCYRIPKESDFLHWVYNSKIMRNLISKVSFLSKKIRSFFLHYFILFCFSAHLWKSSQKNLGAFKFEEDLKETSNSYFCVNPKNNLLMFVSWKF